MRFYTYNLNIDSSFHDKLKDIYENFTGHNFISLDIDRFLLEKGKHYYTKDNNLNLLEYAGEDWRDLVKKDPNKAKFEELNNEASINLSDVENEAKNALNEDDEYFDLG